MRVLKKSIFYGNSPKLLVLQSFFKNCHRPKRGIADSGKIDHE